MTASSSRVPGNRLLIITCRRRSIDKHTGYWLFVVSDLRLTRRPGLPRGQGNRTPAGPGTTLTTHNNLPLFAEEVQPSLLRHSFQQQSFNVRSTRMDLKGRLQPLIYTLGLRQRTHAILCCCPFSLAAAAGQSASLAGYFSLA